MQVCGEHAANLVGRRHVQDDRVGAAVARLGEAVGLDVAHGALDDAGEAVCRKLRRRRLLPAAVELKAAHAAARRHGAREARRQRAAARAALQHLCTCARTWGVQPATARPAGLSADLNNIHQGLRNVTGTGAVTAGGAHDVAGAELEAGADLRDVGDVDDLRAVAQHLRPQLGRGPQEVHPGALRREGLAAVRLAHPLAHAEGAHRRVEAALGRDRHGLHVVVRHVDDDEVAHGDAPRLRERRRLLAHRQHRAA